MDWQVESGKRAAVFVSATTADLGPCRELVTRILIQEGIFPVVQDHFGPDHRELRRVITTGFPPTTNSNEKFAVQSGRFPTRHGPKRCSRSSIALASIIR